MPFNLKNVKATYHRMVTQMFKEQIDRNVEVYVEDLLVKSKEPEVHINDLHEAYAVLQKYKMKLNPVKCAFEVRLGKFIEFMVSKRGIKANSEKIQALINMKPP